MSERWAYGKKSRRGRKVLGAVVGFVLAASAAFAAWSVIANTGSNGGRVKIASLTAPVFMSVADADVVGNLLPGGTEALRFRIDNTNTISIKLVKLELLSDPSVSFNIVPVPGTEPGCSIASLSFIPYDNVTGVVVPTGISFVQVPGTVALATTASTDCQNDLVQLNNLRATFSS